mgnify:CR=1 FL=1
MWHVVFKEDFPKNLSEIPPRARDIYKKYIEHPRIVANPLTNLTVKERAHIRAEVEGVSVSKLGFRRDPNLLSRPRVIDALDRILDESGLTDRKLSKRLNEIIFRGKGANADNTAHNAIRTVWQIKGKFAAEKHEIMHKSDLDGLSEEQLDRIISAGVQEYTIARVKLGESVVIGTPEAKTKAVAP